jgi:hypothetical protein
VTALRKKPKATKRSHHLAINLITHTVKIEEGLKGKLRMDLLDLEEEKKVGMQLGC